VTLNDHIHPLLVETYTFLETSQYFFLPADNYFFSNYNPGIASFHLTLTLPNKINIHFFKITICDPKSC
jgi:hypothetical protein